MLNINKYHNGRGFHSESEEGIYPTTDSQKGKDLGREIGLKQLINAVWKRKFFIVGSILLCGVLAGVVALLLTPTYESDGSLIIKQSPNQFASLGLQNSGLSSILSSSYGLGAGSSLANELEVLRSRKISMKVADSLMRNPIMPNGRQYPVLFKSYPDDSIMISQDTVALKLRAKLTFEKAESNAEVIEIFYESPSALEAAQVVNIAIDKYRELSVNQTRSSANSAVGFLSNERERIKNELGEAEENLRKFMNKNKLVEVDAQTQELIKQIADLEARKQEARTKLVAVNSAIEQYQNKLNSIKPGLAEQYSEAVGPNITRLQYAKSELELQKQQLLANNPNLTSSSPQIQEIDRKINHYKQQIINLTEDLVNENEQYLAFLGGSEGGVAGNIAEMNQQLIELSVEQKQYQAQIEVINAQLAEQELFFNNLPDNIITLAKLKRDVKINEELFIAVSKQYAETSLWEQTQFGQGRVLDEGYIPNEPVSPNIPLFIFLGLLAGGALSVGYLLVLQVFSSTIDSPAEMKMYAPPLLAVIPLLKNSEGDKRIPNVADRTNSYAFSEVFQRLANKIIYSKPETPHSIAITSAKHGEGKTTVTANLAITLAKAGYKTLIIDGNYQNPKIHQFFGIDIKPGVSDIASGGLEVQKAIRETATEGLSVLTCGQKTEGPVLFIQGGKYHELLKELNYDFDFVLVDTSPIGMISDSSALINQSEGVIVVAKFNETERNELDSTLDYIFNINSNFTGTVLNEFNYEKSYDDQYIGPANASRSDTSFPKEMAQFKA